MHYEEDLLFSYISVFFFRFLLFISFFFFFFFNDTATTEIYTLSLHDALPISIGFAASGGSSAWNRLDSPSGRQVASSRTVDRKSTRLNSSHLVISYAVFCLKKKKTNTHSSDCVLTASNPSFPSCRHPAYIVTR